MSICIAIDHFRGSNHHLNSDPKDRWTIINSNNSLRLSISVGKFIQR
ncbi:MAG: hypothetical protein ACTS6P_01205 [Candidatus Hodgkinia cicadicola]